MIDVSNIKYGSDALMHNFINTIFASDWLLLGLCISILFVQLFAMLYWYNRKIKHQNLLRQLRAIIATHKDAWLILDKKYRSVQLHKKAIKILKIDQPESIMGFERFFDLFSIEDKEILELKIFNLTTYGECFQYTAALATDEEVFITFDGCIAQNQKFIIWLRDDSQRITQEKLQNREITILVNEKNKLYNLLNSIVVPIWIRDNNGCIIFCNNEYVRIADIAYNQIINKKHYIWDEEFNCMQNGIVNPLNHGQNVIVDGKRHIYKFYENRLPDMLLGCAVDITQAEGFKTQLYRHQKEHQQLLENLSIAITMYSKDLKLIFFNQAYVLLFNLDTQWLKSKPHIGEVIDKLRARKQLTEMVDYQDYKYKKVQLLSSLSEPYYEYEHLPNGRSVRVVSSPHPNGGVFIVYEDTTDRLDLERQINVLSDVQNKTLDHLYEGIAVFGANLRLTLCNPAFKRIWQYNDEEKIIGLHLDTVLETIISFAKYPKGERSFIEKVRTIFVKREFVNKVFNFNNNEKIIEISYISLPDGSHMLSHLDVTRTYMISKHIKDHKLMLNTKQQILKDELNKLDDLVMALDSHIIKVDKTEVTKQWKNLQDTLVELQRLKLHGVQGVVNSDVSVHLSIGDFLLQLQTDLMDNNYDMIINVNPGCEDLYGLFVPDDIKKIIVTLLDYVKERYHWAGANLNAVLLKNNIMLTISDLDNKDNEYQDEKFQFELNQQIDMDSQWWLSQSLVQKLLLKNSGKITIDTMNSNIVNINLYIDNNIHNEYAAKTATFQIEKKASAKMIGN